MAEYNKEKDVSFRKMLSITQRRRLSAQTNQQHPGSIPVIIEVTGNNSLLGPIKKTFLFDASMSMAQVYFVIRQHLKLKSSEAFFLLSRHGIMVLASKTLLEVFAENKEEDGFLYLRYSPQDVFG